MSSSGAIYQARIASLGGTGIATEGGSLDTLNSTGGVRNQLDDGTGNMVVASGLTVDGTLSLLAPFLINKGVKITALTQTGNYSMSSTDCLILADATAGNLQITLPSLNTGTLAIVKKVDATANTVTVALPSGLIDGAASIVMGTQYESVMVVKSGLSAGVVIASNAGAIL